MSKQWPGDFDALARQYWGAWGDAMRGAAPSGNPIGQAPGAPGWQEAVDWWSRLARGDSQDANVAIDRFNAQARDWFGQMQQVAARFAGQNATATDVASEWKRALDGLGGNPFPDMFRAMQGQATQGLDQWAQAAQPWIDTLRREGTTLLGMPAFGSGREHQERLQKLAQAQLDYQQHEAAYNKLLLKALQDAYAVFEQKLAARGAPGKQLTSARALFDLWVDAAEEAYAAVALSPEFREAYGARVNAQMRLRQCVQAEVEQMSAGMGMPTRSDLDMAFRKIADLERALRTLRDDIGATKGQKADTAAKGDARAGRPNPPPVSKPTRKPTPKPSAKPSVANAKPGAAKPSTAKPAPGKPVRGKRAKGAAR